MFGYDRSDIASPWYRFKMAAGTSQVRTQQGLLIDAPAGLDALRRADTVIATPWPSSNHPPPDDVLAAVRAAHRRGARMVSLCTGAFVLAAAGVLDGRRATTHWLHAGNLAAEYPDVKVEPGVLYVDDGDVLTSAGTAASIDLCLHLVRLDYGAEVANAVARRMVVPPHREGGQAQFVEQPVAAADGGELGRLLDWMLENLDQPLAVDDLAAQAGMSARSFARRFRAMTGTTPHQWLLGQRVALAQRLLESGDLPVEHVATTCGFGSAAGLRLHFQRVVGTSPLAYRRAFREDDG